ncbi:hypothetical protein EII17_04655 [Clostridiales bacterium COT073_COT-073]|nr:hypothetical protein EII17_04655 [Clostridiales bacterium COT073_COT-073]
MQPNQVPSNKRVKHNVKDSLFTFLFHDIKYVKQLYAGLYPEEKDYTDEDFQILTLENIMVNNVYNDLGIMVKDKLIILVEAQSTYNPNMSMRYLIYIAHTYYNYILDHGVNIFGTVRAKFPWPEFFLVYTGERNFGEKILRLSDCYMEQVPDKKSQEIPLELLVHIITKADVEHSILAEYMSFCQIYDKYSQSADTREKRLYALKQTIVYCIEQNILKEFLMQKEREVQEIMMQVFTQEQAMEMVLTEEYNKGREEGMEKGMEKGREEGREEGMEKGKLSIAERMKQMGYSLDEIYKITGLML